MPFRCKHRRQAYQSFAEPLQKYLYQLRYLRTIEPRRKSGERRMRNSYHTFCKNASFGFIIFSPILEQEPVVSIVIEFPVRWRVQQL